jgi:hypothetical protein
LTVRMPAAGSPPSAPVQPRAGCPSQRRPEGGRVPYTAASSTKPRRSAPLAVRPPRAAQRKALALRPSVAGCLSPVVGRRTGRPDLLNATASVDRTDAQPPCLREGLARCCGQMCINSDRLGKIKSSDLGRCVSGPLFDHASKKPGGSPLFGTRTHQRSTRTMIIIAGAASPAAGSGAPSGLTDQQLASVDRSSPASPPGRK